LAQDIKGKQGSLRNAFMIQGIV